MKKTYKVLHIFSGFGGGISSLILNLVENRSENFIFDTLAFSYKGGAHFVEAISRNGGTVYTMPRPRIDGWNEFFSFINDVIKNEKYDAIHCHIAGWMCLPFYITSKKNGGKVFVIHAHTTRYDSRVDRTAPVQFINKIINYYAASQYMTCSDMAGVYIFGKHYLKRKKAKLIPNGIQIKNFSDTISKTEINNYNELFNIPDGVHRVTHIGRFTAPKNHDFILQIADEMKSQNLNCVILLVGDGEKFKDIKEKISSMQLEGFVRLLGRRTDISKIVQYSDCLILPSINEGLPTVAIESQAAGTPILVSNRVTTQCDMNLDLVKFLPIESRKIWVENIKNSIGKKKPLTECVNQIKNNGFTDISVGENYCKELESYIKLEFRK